MQKYPKQAVPDRCQTYKGFLQLPAVCVGIYFDRIKKKINNGEKLTPDEIEWWHNYLDTSVKTVGAIFESLFSMLNNILKGINNDTKI